MPIKALCAGADGRYLKRALSEMSRVSSEEYPMSVLHEERRLGMNQRRALELLAAAGERGCTGAGLFNHGFTVGMLADLVWSGLATGHRETVRVGHRNIKVVRIRITDPGRRALEGY
jgi:hypothetical protein